MREEKTEVLVVGAGPVGLLTALMLAEAGIEVKIIDREERTAARSYACALHWRTLGFLQRLGLADALMEIGRRIRTIAFYDGEARRAELNLAELGPDQSGCLLVLPQSALEKVLEQRLHGQTIGRRAPVAQRHLIYLPASARRTAFHPAGPEIWPTDHSITASPISRAAFS